MILNWERERELRENEPSGTWFLTFEQAGEQEGQRIGTVSLAHVARMLGILKGACAVYFV